MKSKKTYFLFFIVILFISCENIPKDDRLNGYYELEMLDQGFGFFNVDSIGASGTLNIDGINMSWNFWTGGSTGIPLRYKIKNILINNNGGQFYRISDHWPNTAFDEPSQRREYIYVISGNRLVLEWEERGMRLREQYIRR